MPGPNVTAIADMGTFRDTVVLPNNNHLFTRGAVANYRWAGDVRHRADLPLGGFWHDRRECRAHNRDAHARVAG